MTGTEPLPGAVRIVPAGAAHAGIIAHLSEVGAAASWSASAVVRILALPGCWALLAIAPDGEPAGFVMVRIAADEAEILNLVVAEGARRKGIGRALLDAVTARAGRCGVSAMYLEVATANAAGRALYESVGFQQVGNRRDYYRNGDGNYTDALIMKRAIVKSGTD